MAVSAVGLGRAHFGEGVEGGGRHDHAELAGEFVYEAAGLVGRVAGRVALLGEGAELGALFGDGFFPEDSVLASALANVNPQSHGPLAVFNWTRIERAENWPQYHCMTPGVSRAIEALDLERRAVARAFGIELGPIEEHFARSFGTASTRLEDIAAELHAKRGGPPGPVRTDTRYVTEDMPYGLAFVEALGQIAGVPTPATRTIVDAASLVNGIDFRQENDLLAPLGLARETVAGLLARL